MRNFIWGPELHPKVTQRDTEPFFVREDSEVEVWLDDPPEPESEQEPVDPRYAGLMNWHIPAQDTANMYMPSYTAEELLKMFKKKRDAWYTTPPVYTYGSPTISEGQGYGIIVNEYNKQNNSGRLPKPSAKSDNPNKLPSVGPPVRDGFSKSPDPFAGKPKVLPKNSGRSLPRGRG